jgi:ribosomal protein S18 acetylase RimI-like enzyme
MNKWLLRQPVESDVPFIYATLLRSNYFDTEALSQVRKTIYFENYRLVVDELLLNAEVTIACLETDHQVILGYMIHEPGVIHYIFVKDAFRNLGIARSLVTEKLDTSKPLTVTHLTKSVRSLIKNNAKFNFNPYRLYKGVIDGATTEG